MSLAALRRELKKHASREQARAMRRFFKTGPGEYGEGDVFIGVKVPAARKVAQQFRTLARNDIRALYCKPKPLGTLTIRWSQNGSQSAALSKAK